MGSQSGENANVAHLVEHRPSKSGVAGSSPVIRSLCPLVYRLLHPVLVRISGVRFPGGQLKFLIMLITYYLICVAYCFFQLFSKYKQRYDGSVTSNSAELDTIMVIVMAWVLAPIDISLTWIRWYKEAEEAKRRQEKQIL